MRSVAECLLEARQQLKTQRNRRLVLLDGSTRWQHQWLAKFCEVLNSSPEINWLCYGELPLNNVTAITRNHRHHLGTENDIVIFADHAFHPDAFAALSGTLVAGGLFIWCLTEHVESDYFQARIYQQALNDDNTLVIKENTEPEAITRQLSQQQGVEEQSEKGSFRYNCLNGEQETVVEAILKVALGHRNRPLVLTADRGRGKSSTLANACCQLLLDEERTHDIVITAPHSAAVDIFFSQMATVFGQSAVSNVFEYKQHTVRFIPIDVLLARTHANVSLLLVDEAAGIPVYLLEALLTRYHRTVFSSTVHGYEGAGRGFAINFEKRLKRLTPQYNRMQLKNPIRWGENDPLEQFVFKGFCLNAHLPSLTSDVGLNPSLELISRETLQENENLLNEVLALLITAHYQTSPSDVKLILNNPNVRIFVARDNKQLLGTVLAISEGQASDQDINDVKASKRQLKDQFLPQALFKQCGLESAFNYRYLRIMRIAVHPQIQRQGIGRAMLTHVEKYAIAHHYDLLGTSFGATSELICFWQQAQLVPVRLGVLKDKASGQHSLIMLKGLNTHAVTFVEQANHLFAAALPYLLREQFAQLPAKLIIALFKTSYRINLVRPSAHDDVMVLSFAQGQRQLADCRFCIQNWLASVVTFGDEDDISLLIQVIWQHKSVSSLQEEKRTTGKKQLTQQLRQAVTNTLAKMANPVG